MLTREEYREKMAYASPAACHARQQRKREADGQRMVNLAVAWESARVNGRTADMERINTEILMERM